MNRSIDDILRRCLEDCIADIRAAHERAGQKATGRTSAMLESRVRTEGGMLTGEILGWRYTGSYEEGSQPAHQGNGSQKQQMLSQLREWARVRGMTAGMSESEQQSLAYALRKKILREGTSLYRSGGRRDIITPALERLQKDMETKVTDAYMGILTQQIDEQIFRR